jgi:hypothetical protein
LFAPYLLYDAIQRGTLPETMALAIVPWALAAALHALDVPSPRHIVLASFLVVLLILAHNVIPIFALGLLVLLGVVSCFSKLDKRWSFRFSGLRPLLLILGLSLGVTLFFWLPGLVELGDTQSRQAEFPFRQWPSYEQHILPVASLLEMPDDPADPNLLNPPIVRSLGLAQAALALLGMMALFWYPRPVQRRRLVVFALVSITAVYLSSELSLWWWQHFRVLNFIHLPVRFLGLASLGLAVFCGVAVDQLNQWFSKKWQTAVIFLLAALLVSISGWAWLYPQYCPVPQDTTQLMLAQSTTWQRWFAEAQAETLPRWVKELPPEDGLMAQYESGDAINRLVVPDSVKLVDWQTKPAWDSYQLEVSQPTQLTYQTFFFPGWQATIDGKSVPITPSEGQGLITLAVPAGQHRVTISFGPTPLRLVTLLISLLIMVGTAVWAWRYPSPKKEIGEVESFGVFRKALPLLILVTMLLILFKFLVIDNMATPIRANRLQEGRLSGVPFPTNINFENEIRHLGYKGAAEIAADDVSNITHYWMPLRTIGVPYGLEFHVVDDEGRPWHSELARPFRYAHYPSTESWAVGEYVRDAYEIELLPGTPPGTYWLETAVFRRDTDLSLIPTGGEVGSSPDQARIGRLRVLPGEWELDAETAQVNTFEPTAITAVPQLSLVGWTVPDVVWRPGQYAQLDLLWHGNQVTLDERVVVDLVLKDETGKESAQLGVIVGDSVYPLTTRPETAVVRDKVQWRLPPDLETNLYTVWLTSGEQEIELGQWQIDAPTRTFEQPEVDITSDFEVWFAHLVGYSWSETAVSPGESVELELVWQADGEQTTSYRVFVHLLDDSGNLVTQSDAIPDRWTRPTTGWMVGEYIRDSHTLSLPSNLTSGDYTLLVGFYDTVTSERLGEAEIGVLTVGDG